tara:strand:+ start:1115 stop:1687 length:573 start_codon:yes stop_codon:yes gene_type:complete
MSKESVLKKEFKEKDVQRLRNLMTGKHGERNVQGVGYTKVEEFHEEGDVWDDNGRTWTIKNGIKQNITKLDAAKKSIHMPLFCPSCKNQMKKQLDKRFYLQFNHCLDCQIDFEAELRHKGLWKEEDIKHTNDNIDNMVVDFEALFNEALNASNEDFITESGDVEKWVGSNKNKILESKQETIDYLKSLKK